MKTIKKPTLNQIQSNMKKTAIYFTFISSLIFGCDSEPSKSPSKGDNFKEDSSLKEVGLFEKSLDHIAKMIHYKGFQLIFLNYEENKSIYDELNTYAFNFKNYFPFIIDSTKNNSTIMPTEHKFLSNQKVSTEITDAKYKIFSTHPIFNPDSSFVFTYFKIYAIETNTFIEDFYFFRIEPDTTILEFVIPIE